MDTDEQEPDQHTYCCADKRNECGDCNDHADKDGVGEAECEAAEGTQSAEERGISRLSDEESAEGIDGFFLDGGESAACAVGEEGCADLFDLALERFLLCEDIDGEEKSQHEVYKGGEYR